MVFRRPLIASVKSLRSSVTNDPYRLPGVDMGGAYGRRFRDLVRDLALEFGGVEKLGAIELVLIRQAAGDVIRSERMQATMARGGAVSDEELTRVGNSARAALTRLRERRPRLDPTPSLQKYLDANAEVVS